MFVLSETVFLHGILLAIIKYDIYVYHIRNIYICNELGGGRRRLDSGATGVGRSGSHKEQQTHSGDGI